MKFIITENKKERVTINWLNQNYSNLNEFRLDAYLNNIFYMSDDGSLIFHYNVDTKDVVISYEYIWDFLTTVFKFDYEDINKITKKWVEDTYNLVVNDILTLHSPTHIEIRYKNRYESNN